MPGTVLGMLDLIEQSTGIFTQSSAGVPSLKTVGRKVVCVVNEGMMCMKICFGVSWFWGFDSFWYELGISTFSPPHLITIRM